jgi:hypothetical protein
VVPEALAELDVARWRGPHDHPHCRRELAVDPGEVRVIVEQLGGPACRGTLDDELAESHRISDLDVLGRVGSGKQRQPVQHAGKHQVRQSKATARDPAGRPASRDGEVAGRRRR